MAFGPPAPKCPPWPHFPVTFHSERKPWGDRLKQNLDNRDQLICIMFIKTNPPSYKTGLVPPKDNDPQHNDTGQSNCSHHTSHKHCLRSTWKRAVEIIHFTQRLDNQPSLPRHSNKHWVIQAHLLLCEPSWGHHGTHAHLGQPPGQQWGQGLRHSRTVQLEKRTSSYTCTNMGGRNPDVKPVQKSNLNPHSCPSSQNSWSHSSYIAGHSQMLLSTWKKNRLPRNQDLKHCITPNYQVYKPLLSKRKWAGLPFWIRQNYSGFQMAENINL